MLTPQEVSARSFTKTMMGGYNMTMVDEFLDELTDDYTSLYKENASLKAKMKVLVEKVEEYRATEDSMRATLLTAQRMADSIVKEAEAKRDDILKQAESAAREKLDGYRKEAERCGRRLQQGQEEMQRFLSESRALCEKQMRFLEEFPNLQVEADGAEAIEVEEIEEKILAAGEAESAPPEMEAPPVQTVPEPQTAFQASQAEEPQEEPEPEAADLAATQRVNINKLKFGPNYRSAAD